MSSLTGEGRITTEGQDVVDEIVERQAYAGFPPEVQENLGVKRYAPAATPPRKKTHHNNKTIKQTTGNQRRFVEYTWYIRSAPAVQRQGVIVGTAS